MADRLKVLHSFFDSSSSTHISLTHGTPIPSGTTIVAVGGDGKVVLEAERHNQGTEQCSIFNRCNTLILEQT